ncbi:MAG: signal recognition particle protein, partial [Lachnospiraceae bacterium]
EFDEKIGVDGIVLSKMDGDTRGGAALSVKAVTGKPILYVGMGEKLSDLEQFYPDRMASRILGMGDVLSLIDKVQANIEIDADKEKDMAARMKKGKFDFEDYLESMKQMKKLGGLSSVLSMMPGMGMKTGDLESMVDEKQLARMEAIVLSMTPAERKNPKLLNPQRKFRIAKGAGVDIAVVNRFIKQFEQSQKLMKQFGGGKRKGFGGFPGMGGKGRFPF